LHALLKTPAGKYIWRFINAVRYRHLGPQRAVHTENAQEESIRWLWKGIPPEPFFFVSQYSFLNLGRADFHVPFVVLLSDGKVIGRRGDVVTSQGTVLTDISPEIPRRPDDHFLLERGNTSRPQRLSGTVAVLNCGPHSNFYHFMFDAIGRLQFLRQTPVEVDYYCTSYHLPFQRELLSWFGIDSKKIIPLERKTHLQADQLLVSSLPGYCYDPDLIHIKDKGVYHFVRQHMLDKVSRHANSKAYPDKIYIQRRGKRRLVNEAEVLEKLNKAGRWQVVCLEELPVLEQAALFHHASFIIGVHGAGLANIIYCRPGTSLLEIFHPELLEPVYFQIASLYHLEYRVLIGEKYQRAGRKSNEDVFQVDPERLVQLTTYA